MATAFEVREEAELRELLGGYLTHVPPAVCNGSYNLSVEFKAAVIKAKKVLTKRGVSNADLRGAVNSLHRYWEMK